MDEDLDYPAKLEQSAETKSETSSVSVLLFVIVFICYCLSHSFCSPRFYSTFYGSVTMYSVFWVCGNLYLILGL